MSKWSTEGFTSQQENPAAPAGLQQQARAQQVETEKWAATPGATQDREGKWSIGGLQKWAPQDSYVRSAQSWYGGQNTQGVSNGFDTEFQGAAFRYIASKEEQAGRTKNPNDLWGMWDVTKVGNEKATGVATWDDPTGQGRWKVGDVFENGKNLGANLYDQFDEKTADLMLSDYILTANEKKRIFASGDRDAQLREQVRTRTAEMTETAKNAPAAWDFNQATAAREQDFQESGASDVGSFLAGAGGGAATVGGTAAVIAAAGGPIGWATAGLLTAGGALVGGVTGWLNRDQMTEVAARAAEVSDRAYERYGYLGGTATAIKEFSALSTRALSPISNAYQGVYDAVAGDLGDGDSEFYAVNESGQRKAGALHVGLDMVASLGDALLQFGSPAGRLAYMGNMGMTTTGGVLSLGTGGTFNARIGDFDKYENAGEWMAALGNVTIDAAQMGGAHGLFNAAKSAKARVLDEALPTARRTENLAGIKFTLDDQGRAIDSRMTAELLAPSELLRYIPTRMKARNLAARQEGRAIDHNDLYIAARQMTNSGSRFRDALFMGYVEGAEEFVQAALEPASVSEDLNPAQMFEAALYGAVSGVGMSLGNVMSRPSNAQQQEARARLHYMMRTGSTPTAQEFKEIYKGMTALERERLATADPGEAMEIQGHLKFHEGMMTIDRSRNSALGAAVAQDFSMTNFDRGLAKINPAADSNLVILGRTSIQQVMPDGTMETVDAPNVGVMSAFEAVNSVRKLGIAHDAQLKSVKDDLAKVTDPTERQELEARRAELEAQATVDEEILGRLLAVYNNELLAATDDRSFRRAINRMNNILHNAATGQWTDKATKALLPPEVQELYRRAAEIRLSRHPYIDSGSFGILVPQVSFGYTVNNINSTIGVHQGLLKPFQADHDGDRFATINLTYASSERLRDIRRGVQMFDTTFDEATGQDVMTLAIDDPDGEETILREFSQYLWDPMSKEAQAVGDAIVAVKTALEERYITNPPQGQRFLNAKVLTDLMLSFEQDVIAGNKKARSNLINGIFRISPETVIAYGDANNVAEPLYLQDLISNAWDTAQKQIAALAMTTTTAAPNVDVRRPEDRAFQRDVARLNAANASTTMGILGSGDGTRDAQMLWYSSFYRAAINAMDPAKDSNFITAQQALLTQRFIELGQGESQTAFEMIANKNSIENRVLSALRAIQRSTPTGSLTGDGTLIQLAQTRVPNLVYNEARGEYVVEQGEITLLQLLLRKSLQVEKNLRRAAPPDAAINAKIKKLESLTYAQETHSYSASTALLEIFGNEQLINLIGGDAKYLGQNLTLNQLLKSVQGMHEVNRNRDIRAWRSAPAYASHHGKGDPPYSVSDYAPDPDSDALPMNAFTMVVDALAASVNTAFDALESRDNTAHKNMITILSELKGMVDVWARDNSKRLRKEGKDINRRAILEDMLDQRKDVAALLAPMIPDAVRLGAFQVIDGRIHTANWIMEVLTNPDFEKAALMYHVYSGFTEFNVVGGGLDIDDIENGNDPDPGDVGIVDPAKLKTQFAMTIYRLMQESSGVEMARFLKAVREAPSLKALYTQINDEPVWRGNRAKLLPYHQDISLYQTDPGQQFTPNLPGALLRQTLEETATRISVVGAATLEESINRRADQITLTNMLEFLESGTAKDNADQYVGLLGKAIKNAQMAMDSMGQAARDQYLEVVQDAIARMQDKGKADPRVAPAGEWLVTADTSGLKMGWALELDALTSMDWGDVRSNLTRMLRGPFRIQLHDGAEMTVDMSDPKTLVRMLRDERTAAFAKAVLFPTVRDVNNANVLQHYTDSDNPGSITKMLEEASFAHFFKEVDTPAAKLKQATRLTNFVEAAVRQESLVGSREQQVRAFLPLTNTHAEFLTAYMHGVKAEKQNQEQVRQRVIIEVADALKSIAALPPSQRERVRLALKARMVALYQGDMTAIEKLAEKTVDQDLLDDAWQDDLLSSFADIQAEATNNLIAKNTALATATDPQKIAALEADIKYWEDRLQEAESNWNALRTKSWSDLRLQYKDVDSAIRQYTLLDKPGPGMSQQDFIDANNQRKERIRDFLGYGNRKERFRAKDTNGLIEKLRFVTHEGSHMLFDDRAISPEEWDELGRWAATSYISESSTRSASDVNLIPLPSDPESHIRRYYDVSWGYLIDGLFDDRVLAATEYAINNATYPRDKSEDEVVVQISNTLLHPDRLGQWTDRIPVESEKARKLLQGSSVGLAVPVGGIIPKTTQDQVGVAWLSFAKPDPTKHHSLATVSGPKGAQVANLFSSFERNKLENHFVKRITLKSTGLAADMDITAGSTFVATATEEVATSGYTVLQLNRLQAKIEQVLDTNNLQDFEVEIEYVDVDKTPYTREYANSIYFDGVGPGAALGTTGGGPVAQSIFGTGGWSKIAQQSVLDFAARGGSGFVPTTTSELGVTLALEDPNRNPTVAERLLAKVEHMWAKGARAGTSSYDIGRMTHQDRPALYKLVKQRHVLVGKSAATGEKLVMWSAEYISREANGEPTGFADTPKLVALSETVAATLLSDSTTNGIPDIVTRPELNAMDLNPVPSLDNARLERLGLGRLGMEVDWDDNSSPLFSVVALPKATVTAERGAAVRTVYEEKLKLWTTQAAMAHAAALKRLNWSQTAAQIRATNGRDLQAMLEAESLAWVFARLNIPFPQMRDVASAEVSRMVAKNLEALTGGSTGAIFWKFRQDSKTGSLDIGLLSPDLIHNDFEMMGDRPPVYGDVVTLELDSFLIASAGDVDKAEMQAQAVIRSFAGRGLTIALTSDNGDTGLRGLLTDWIQTGAVEMRQLANSAHIFTPIVNDSAYGTTRRALLSTLGSVQHFTGHDLTFRFLTDTAGVQGANENTVFVDFQHDKVRTRLSQMLLPAAIINTNGNHNGEPLLFNIPVTDLDGVDQMKYVMEKTAAMLADPDIRKHLKGLTNDDRDPKKADPGPPVNKFRRTVTPGGKVIIEPGVLDIDAALDMLESQVKAGEYPLGQGKELMTGQIVPYLAGDGKTIYFSRVGYKTPDGPTMAGQLAEGYGPDGMKLHAIIASNALNTNQTVPPPFTQIEDPRPEMMGLFIKGQYDLKKYGKWIDEGLGYKEGAIALEHYAFPTQGLSNQQANDARVTEMASLQGPLGKRVVPRDTILNFRELFAFGGIDFRDIMVDFMYGANPSRSEDEFNDLWGKTQRILKQVAANDHGLSMEAVAQAMQDNSLVEYLARVVNDAGAGTAGWNQLDIPAIAPVFEPDPKEALALRILHSLLAPGVQLEHVIATPGLVTIPSMDSDAQVTRMPSIFTDSLVDLKTPKMRDMLFDMVNANMPIDANGKRLYEFTNDFQFHIQMQPLGPNGKPQGPVEWKKGYLQIVMPQPAEENSASYEQAGIAARKDETRHLINVINGALAARIETSRDPYASYERRLFDNKIIRFGEPDDEGKLQSFWDMLKRVKPADKHVSPWDALTPMEWGWVTAADQRVGQYIRPIDKTDPIRWPSPDVANRRADELLTALGLTSHMEQDRIEVDYLVRQFYGRPAPAADQVDYKDELTEDLFNQAVSIMLENVKDHIHPLHGGMVPFEHKHFWKKVYDANIPAAGGWAPAVSIAEGRGKNATLAKDWDQWVTTLVGQMRDSNAEFQSMYRLDMDGFWHTYQGSTGSLATMSTSMDPFIEMGLMEKDTNEFYLSLDTGQNALLRDPIILDTMRASLDTLAGYDADFKASVARFVPNSELADQLKRQQEWLRGKKIPKQEKLTFRQYMSDGAVYIESKRGTTNVFRGLVNMSIFTRLLNPALWASAFIEVPARNAMEHTVNLLTGQHIGLFGESIAALGTKAGVAPKYTEREVFQLKELARQMGQSNKFLSLLYEDITFKNFVERGARGTIGSKMEWLAAASARATSDPTFGMKATSAAKRYLEAVLEYYAYTDASFSIDQFVQKMEQNPLYVQEASAADMGFSAHNAGMNRVAQVRSVKATTLSKAIMSPVESMMASSSASVNSLGLLLKIPFLFTRFNANAFMTLTGLNGLDQVAAMLLDGRKKGAISDMLARVRGENPESGDRYHDMSDVLEGFDLTRPMIRMGVTQTGLMAAALMAQNFGLGGEDEEMRKRRQLAKYLNGPLIMDPREVQNDFLMADALFLDQFSLFGLNTIFQDEGSGRSAVVPHWIFRQFLSPMMGVQRFLETGNWGEIRAGFIDAASVVPYSAITLWKEADLTAELLAQAAADENLDTSAAAQSSAVQLLINIAGVYEKALLENSFVNAIRNGADEYNRNPWLVAQTNETGQIVHAEGRNDMPLRTDALQEFVNEEGEAGAGYRTRSGMDAQAHQYAENNATFALLASVFTGQFSGDSTFRRNNMVVAEKTVVVPEIDRDKIEALILSAYQGTGGQEALTYEETVRILKAADEKAGIYWNQADIEARADVVYAANSGKIGALSVISEDGREMITQDGADGVFTSLAAGALDIKDMSMRGMWIPWEMRDAIAEDWATKLIQEGVDLGLGKEAAFFRMNRIMKGDPTNPDVPGLRDIIYSKDIPGDGNVKYNQLNMTYMVGPDGRPWATPFGRQNVAQAFGVPLPTATKDAGAGLSKDSRGKLVDDLLGINLGLNGLERKQVEPEERPIPEQPLLNAMAKSYTPSSGSAWRTFPRRSYGGSGGYSSSYYGPRFERMPYIPTGQSPRTDGIMQINTNTPQIRRARVEADRIQSERGRLKQWQ